MKSLSATMRRTIESFGLIENGDRVAVGLSGGKDSMALLFLLKKYHGFSTNKFELKAITIDPGFDNFNLAEAKIFCDKIDVEHIVIKTEIAKIVFDIRNEKNPCALCANMRRGALADAMNERGLNKLALGHHADDALSTMFLNMLYTGKINTLEYMSYLSRADIHVIRPFLDASEAQIVGLINSEGLPILKSPCPVDKHTKREEIADMLRGIYKTIPNSRKNLLTAMRNEEKCNLFVNKPIKS